MKMSVTPLRLAAVLVAVATSLAVGAAPAHAYADPLIWVGSPVDGTWGTRPYADTTPAGGHHRLVKATPRNDWSVDLRTGAGSDVYLYAAPSNSAFNNAVTARVTQIVDDNACSAGGGGDFVTVGIYYNGTLYGHATYAHLDRDGSLYVGKPISRWGTWLGKVASLTGGATGGSNCWTGPHVHFELRAQSPHWSCWNRTYANFVNLYRTNFVGFVSGPLSTTRAMPCA